MELMVIKDLLGLLNFVILEYFFQLLINIVCNLVLGPGTLDFLPDLG